jgi:hypothetical protein
MKRSYSNYALRAACLSVLVLMMSGCDRGYLSGSELARRGRGPEQCAESCEELGMRMGAFVLMQRAVAGCVCEPNPGGPTVADQGSGASIGGMAVIIAQQQAQQQQQQASQAH